MPNEKGGLKPNENHDEQRSVFEAFVAISQATQELYLHLQVSFFLEVTRKDTINGLIGTSKPEILISTIK